MAGLVPVELAATEPQRTSPEIGRIKLRRDGDCLLSIYRLVDLEALRLALEEFER